MNHDSTMDFTLHSWVDESMHSDLGLYILAAVVCDPAGCDQTRDTLRLLRYKRQERLHWRDEDVPRRAKIAAAIAEVDMAAVVVVGAPMEKTKQERARRLCMEALLLHLTEMGVTRGVQDTKLEQERCQPH